MHTYKVKIKKKWNKEILESGFPDSPKSRAQCRTHNSKYGFIWFHQEDTEDDQKPWFAQRYFGHYCGLRLVTNITPSRSQKCSGLGGNPCGPVALLGFWSTLMMPSVHVSVDSSMT